jgi:hypothetical protein
MNKEKMLGQYFCKLPDGTWQLQADEYTVKKLKKYRRKLYKEYKKLEGELLNDGKPQLPKDWD